jgi:hypothetical protein
VNNFRSNLIKLFDIAFYGSEREWPGKRNRLDEMAFSILCTCCSLLIGPFRIAARQLLLVITCWYNKYYS